MPQSELTLVMFLFSLAVETHEKKYKKKATAEKEKLMILN